MKLDSLIKELSYKTTENNQYKVLTSSQNGIVTQDEYFNKQIASQDNTGYKIIKKGEFTYRSMSDTGKFYINRLDAFDIGIVSPAYPVFKISSNIIKPEYLELFFKSNDFQNQISNQSTGSTRLALRYSKLKNVQINVPSIEKQLVIVDSINRLNTIILNQRKEIEILDELIKSRFNEMFSTDFSTDKWSNVVIIKNGRDYKKTPNNNGTYPIYGSGGYMGIRCDQYITKEMSIIIGRKGNVTKPLFVKEKFWNVDTAFGIEPGPKLNPYYFFFHCLDIDLESMVTGSTIPSLTKKQLLDLQIKIPPIELQNEFADFVKQIDKLKFNIQKRIDLYQELLDKKMDEYFG